MIGATAFPVHGYSRATLDIDLFIKPDRDNATTALEALKAFGYDVTDVSVEDLLTKNVLIRQDAVETDVHPFVAGVEFDQVWRRAVRARYGRTVVPFASLEDLIRMKRAAGRAKDREDLRYLTGRSAVGRAPGAAGRRVEIGEAHGATTFPAGRPNAS